MRIVEMIAGIKICIICKYIFKQIMSDLSLLQFLFEIRVNRLLCFCRGTTNICNAYLEVVSRYVTPFVIFDGLPLPAKEDERNDRKGSVFV